MEPSSTVCVANNGWGVLATLALMLPATIGAVAAFLDVRDHRRIERRMDGRPPRKG